MLLSGVRLNLCIGLPVLLIGLGVGFIRGQTTKMDYKDGAVVGRNSLIFLIAWGASVFLAQLLNLIGSALLSSIGLIPLFFSTGSQIGINGNIFIRRLQMEYREPKPADPKVLISQSHKEPSPSARRDHAVTELTPNAITDEEAKAPPSSLPERG